MPFVGFPSATIAIQRMRLNFSPTNRAKQHPQPRRIRHNAVQRVADQLAAFASFDSGSGGFWHERMVSELKSVKLADKPDFVRRRILPKQDEAV